MAEKLLKIAFISLFWILLIDDVYAQVCSGNNILGVGKPRTKADNVDSNTDTYYMICNNIYTIDCCGSANRYQFYSLNDGVIEFMVWRQISATSYVMAWSVNETITGAGDAGVQTALQFENFHTQPGDCIGWHASGIDMISYNADSSGIDTRTLPASSVDTSGPVDWSVANTEPRRNRYGINIRLVDPVPPVFATATTAFSISDITALGTSITVVTFTDGDNYDTHTLTLSGTEATYFDLIDNGDMTGLIQVSNTTAVGPLSDSTATLLVVATDLCFTSTTGTITVFVSNSPPAITNLDGTASVSENVASETLLTTFTCTDRVDEVDASILNIVPSNAPSPEFFFVRETSGSGTSKQFGLYARAQDNPAEGVFDMNTQSSYDVTIQCTDTKDPVTGNLVVSVTEATTTSSTTTTTTPATTTSSTTSPATTTSTTTTPATTTSTTTTPATTTSTTTTAATSTTTTTTPATTTSTTTTPATTTSTITTPATTTSTTTTPATTTSTTTSPATSTSTTTTPATTTLTTTTPATTTSTTTTPATTTSTTTTTATTTIPATISISTTATTSLITKTAPTTTTTPPDTTTTTTTEAPVTQSGQTGTTTPPDTTPNTPSTTTIHKALTTSPTYPPTTTGAPVTQPGQTATTTDASQTTQTTLAGTESSSVNDTSSFTTFLDNEENIPWFVATMVLLAVTVVIFSIVIAKCGLRCKSEIV